MIGVYCLVPIIIIIKKFIGEKKFIKFSWIFLGLACISAWTSRHKLNWDIGYSFYYVGYFIIGFILRKTVTKKNNRKGFVMLVISITILFFVAYLRYQQAKLGISDNELKYGLLNPYSPLIMIASVILFAGISAIHIKLDLGKFASLTFYIYLMHAGIWDIFCRIISGSMDNRIVIPISIIIVFLCSLIAAKIYIHIWNFVDTKYNISVKLSRWIIQ